MEIAILLTILMLTFICLEYIFVYYSKYQRVFNHNRIKYFRKSQCKYSGLNYYI